MSAEDGVPDLASQLKSLEMERDLLEIDELEQSRRMFKSALIPATQQICHLATYAVNEKLRSEMARYVVERNLGTVRDGIMQPAEDPFERLLASCVVEYDEEEAAAAAAVFSAGVVQENDNLENEGE